MLRHFKFTILVVVLGCLLLTSCSSNNNNSNNNNNKTTAKLIITVTIEKGLSADVKVTGPDGFKETLTKTKTLEDLKVGNYQIVAATVVANPNNSIIATAYSASVDKTNISVAANETKTVTVTYSQRGGSGHLWLAIGRENTSEQLLSSFSANLLAKSGTPKPTSTLSGNNTSLSSPNDIAFDAKGNLWVANYSKGNILKFTPSQQINSGNPTPEVVISSSILEKVFTLTFDSQGSLWAGTQIDKIVKFTSAQLASSGNPTPVVNISRNFAFGLPRSLVFDSNGNLWMSLINDDRIVMHSKAQLASSADNATPAIILAGFVSQANIVFDSRGNLWTGSPTEDFRGKILKLNKSQLSNSSNNVVPDVTIEGLTGKPSSLAFDVIGNLWVLVSGDNKLLKYTPNQIAISGKPNPAISIDLEGKFDQNAMAFNP